MSNEILAFTSATELLAYLHNQGVQIAVDNGRLVCQAAKGVLTPQLQAELRSRKQEILDQLRHAAETQRPEVMRCIHELFAAQAAATPDAVAVISGSASLTYHELAMRSRRLANRLLTLGVRPEILVGVCLERSTDMVVALLAVLQAGGAYVPLDPQFPPARLQFMLEDCKAAVLITRGDLLKFSTPDRTAVLCLDRDCRRIDEKAPVETMPARPDNLAYVIYTSGSTGVPKGVAVEHHSVVNLLESVRREPGISEHDRFLAITTLSFDIAALEIFLPLITGAQLVIAPRSAVADGQALARLLRDLRITMMQATPATWRLLVDTGWEGLPSLRMLCGGEELPRDLAERLLASGAELWNLYGPTETTIWSTIHRVEDGTSRVPIGKPIANTQTYVLDENRQKLPVGVPGELYIGGDGLAREYLGRPELTAERFVADPFSPGRRLYRTGDLARFTRGGTLEYLGRNDYQVKLRGFRIELGEIEAALERMPEIRQTVVQLREDEPGHQRLTAYIVSSRPPEPKQIRKALAAKLPEYMIPSAFVFLDSLPLTPNNKIDRKALPAPVEHLGVCEAPIPNQLSSTADKIAALWRGLLKVPAVALHDNFFALGGNSLLIVQLQNQIRRQLAREVSIADLFQHPTVAGLAELLDQDQSNDVQDEWPSAPAAALNLLRNGSPITSAGKYGPALVETEDWSEVAAGKPAHGGSLVKAKPRGSRLPLFMIAGFQGPEDTLLVLSRIIPYLDPEQPIYGLRPRWIEGGELYASVQEEALSYLTEIRTVQPKGPYLLGGYCLSGLVAFEMAQQLLASGEQVGLLALIDTERPTPVRTFAANVWNGMQRAHHVGRAVRDLFRLNDQARSGAVRDLIRRKIRKIGRPEITGASPVESFYRAKMGYQRILREYVATGFPGRVTLIVNEGLYKGLDRRRGWDQIPIGELIVKKVPGDHLTMFSQHGKEMARLLIESIDKTVVQTDDPAVEAAAS